MFFGTCDTHALKKITMGRGGRYQNSFLFVVLYLGEDEFKKKKK